MNEKSMLAYGSERQEQFSFSTNQISWDNLQAYRMPLESAKISLALPKEFRDFQISSDHSTEESAKEIAEKLNDKDIKTALAQIEKFAEAHPDEIKKLMAALQAMSMDATGGYEVKFEHDQSRGDRILLFAPDLIGGGLRHYWDIQPKSGKAIHRLGGRPGDH